jgi:ABC-type transport system involved in multi-copper enzyme maturation permease subunit
MRWLLSFPLLTKELTEQSARKRTYVLRFVYATLLLLAFALVYQQTARFMSDQSLGMIGKGGTLFDALFYCQYWAILLLMPALAAGSLTSEKEQGSLTILLLTDLGPWELVLQKWLSRLVTVGSFLLLSTPLMGLCYAFGGLEAERLVLGIYILLLTCMQTAAVAIALSAWCRGSIAALLSTYGLLLVMYAGPALNTGGYQRAFSYYSAASLFELLWPERLFSTILNVPTSSVMMFSIPVLLSIAFALAFARWALPRRAQLTGPGPLLGLFRRLDGLFERGDVKLGRQRARTDLPDQAPVAWRELNRRSLANWRYLVRFLVAGLGTLVLVFTLIAASGGTNNLSQFLHLSGLSLLGVILLLVLVLGSTLIAAERTQQTLDVLLTTPLTARTILVEKMRGLRRITWAILFSAVLILLWGAYERSLYAHHDSYNSSNDSSDVSHLSEIVATCAYFIILPPLFTWFAVAIGLYVRSRNRAMITALFGGCLWLGSTMIFALTLFVFLDFKDNSPVALFIYLTPGYVPLLNEIGNGQLNGGFGGALLAITVFILWHGGLWFFLRWWCLRHADRLMRRGAGS